MAAVVVAAAAGLTATGLSATGTFLLHKVKRARKESYEIVAAAFSAMFGVRIICEKEAKPELAKGIRNVKRLEIKDFFKTKPSNFHSDEESLYYIPDSAYDPQYDYDFTNYNADDKECTRGKYSYQRPTGWNRKAVKVFGKYENDVWLGRRGWRSKSSPGEWQVSYYGVEVENIHNNITDVYEIKKCTKCFGKGIYSTPDIKVAEQYATEFNYNGEKYKCILQTRVNLEKTKEVEALNLGPFFVTPDEDDIRPYGVCIKKSKQTSWDFEN